MKYIFLTCKALVCMGATMLGGAVLMLLVDGLFMRGIAYVPNNPGGLVYDSFVAYVLVIACLWLYAVYNWKRIEDKRLINEFLASIKFDNEGAERLVAALNLNGRKA